MPGAAISSCIVGQKSTLFYVDAQNFVHTLTAEEEKESTGEEGRTDYRDAILVTKGTKLKSSTKEMAAISWQGKTGAWRSRLYYSDSNGVLQGLNREGEAEWDNSDIGTLNAKVTPNTSITALFSPGAGNSIKVYYYKPGENKPYVAWWQDEGDRRWKTASTS